MLVWEQAEGCAAWNVNGFWLRSWAVQPLFDLSWKTVILLSTAGDLNWIWIWSLKKQPPLKLKDVICDVCFSALEHLWCDISVVFLQHYRNDLLYDRCGRCSDIVLSWICGWWRLSFKAFDLLRSLTHYPFFWSLETQTHRFMHIKRFFPGSGKSI